MLGSRLTLERPHWVLLAIYGQSEKRPEELHFFPSWEKHQFNRHECWCEPNVGSFDGLFVYLHEPIIQAIPPAEGLVNEAD